MHVGIDVGYEWNGVKDLYAAQAKQNADSMAYFGKWSFQLPREQILIVLRTWELDPEICESGTLSSTQERLNQERAVNISNNGSVIRCETGSSLQ